MQFNIDGHRILKVLKESEYGAVLLAEHESLGARRIIKCLDHSHPDYGQLVREAGIMQKFKNGSIPVIYDIWEKDGVTYFSEEFIEGESLKNYLKRRDCLSKSELLNYSIQLSEILVYIHNPTHRVLHLDLKPENIIVTDHNIKLIDFGSAICRENDLTDTKFYGTPGFCAPEQTEGGSIDFYTDIWSLGKIFEYMLMYTPVSPAGYKKITDSCLRRSKVWFTDSREVRDALVKLSGKRSQKWYEEGVWIAVSGIPTDYHSTYFSLMLAGLLKQKRGGKVLILDCNRKRNLERLDEKDAASGSRDYSFKMDGITIARRVLYEDVKGWRGRGFDYIICDFGTELSDVAGIRFAKKYLVGSLQPWTREEWDTALSYTGYSKQTVVVITEGSRSFGSDRMAKCEVIGDKPLRLSHNVTRCILKGLKKKTIPVTG